jgi:RNA polymerase sigma-70 factor (family 1)
MLGIAPKLFGMQKREILSETEMIEGFRLGEERAFSEVFRALFPSLTYYAFRITKNQLTSEDIAEDAFIKIWDRRESFYQFDVLKSYVYTIVRNASFTWLRKNKTVQIHSIEETTDVSSQDKNRMEAIIEVEVFHELHVFLERLPRQSKKIIKMIFLDGKKAREVAEELGLSLSTVKNQKANALNKLKKYYYS